MLRPLRLKDLSNFIVMMQVEDALREGRFVHVVDEDRGRFITLAHQFNVYFVLIAGHRGFVAKDFEEFMQAVNRLKGGRHDIPEA